MMNTFVDLAPYKFRIHQMHLRFSESDLVFVCVKYPESYRNFQLNRWMDRW